jgi:hypothetical protein
VVAAKAGAEAAAHDPRHRGRVMLLVGLLLLSYWMTMGLINWPVVASTALVLYLRFQQVAKWARWLAGLLPATSKTGRGAAASGPPSAKGQRTEAGNEGLTAAQTPAEAEIMVAPGDQSTADAATI